MGSSTWSADVLRKVQRRTVVPSFMDPRNRKMLRATPELWFSCGAAGGGAKAHVDQHTESTMSLQLSGRKRWRVAPMGRRTAPHIMKLYQDGQIYNRGEHNRWNILEDVVLHPGDAFFFGPGFIHQTDAEPGACAASITWQFNIPAPSTYWRNFLPRIRWTPDLIHTWGLLRRIIMQPTGRGSEADPFFDIDGDGHVSPSEKTRVRDLWMELERPLRDELPKKLQKGAFGFGRIVEDAEDLASLPPKVQKAVKQWEEKALATDEKAATAWIARPEL